MKLGHLIPFTILIVISAAFAQNFKNENSPRWFKFKPKTEPLMKTFSLSVVGDFSFSRITNFLMKIFEGITECKYIRLTIDLDDDIEYNKLSKQNFTFVFKFLNFSCYSFWENIFGIHCYQDIRLIIRPIIDLSI